jgi:hypothetical protein
MKIKPRENYRSREASKELDVVGAINTFYIDKSSSAELSEAMFN